MSKRPTRSTLFPYTTLFRSVRHFGAVRVLIQRVTAVTKSPASAGLFRGALSPSPVIPAQAGIHFSRSEEHTSELQSQSNLVCRLLLEKKNKLNIILYISRYL